MRTFEQWKQEYYESQREAGLLHGYKGQSFMDAGYFYAPYIPLQSTPIVLDPNSFSPRKGILTRYGKKLLEQGAKFYDKLEIKGPVQ